MNQAYLAIDLGNLQVEGQDKVVNMGWDEEWNIGQDRELDNNENENK